MLLVSEPPAVVPPEAAAQLDLLQESVIALIHRAGQCGSVVIITNAETGWVEMSCKKFMPRVFPLLGGMRILSARSAFEGRFPDSPSDWKVRHRRLYILNRGIEEGMGAVAALATFGLPACRSSGR